MHSPFWHFPHLLLRKCRSSCPAEVFLVKVVLELCSKFAREHPCRSVISVKLFYNFIEIILRHGRSPVNLLHIFRTPFPKNTSGWLLLTRTSLSCMYIFMLVTWRYVMQLWLLDFAFIILFLCRNVIRTEIKHL